MSEGPGGALGPLAGNILGLLDNDDDKQRAAEEASRRAGDSGNSDLFKTILGSLSSDKDKVAREDIDEEGERLSDYPCSIDSTLVERLGGVPIKDMS